VLPPVGDEVIDPAAPAPAVPAPAAPVTLPAPLPVAAVADPAVPALSPAAAEPPVAGGFAMLPARPDVPTAPDAPAFA
jgi:hypothetical protein